METITTAMSTAITGLSTNLQTAIGANLPAIWALPPSSSWCPPCGASSSASVARLPRSSLWAGEGFGSPLFSS